MRRLILTLVLVGWWGYVGAQGPTTPKIICAYPASGAALPSGCHAAQMVQLGMTSSKITYALAGRLRTLNPIVALDRASLEVSRAIHAGLLEGTVESPEPAVAERFALSADRTSVTFALRQGVRFSDGVALSAEDVRFTFERLIYPAEITTPWRDGLRCADGALPTVTALSPSEIRFSCKTPMGRWQLWQIGSVPILPKHKLQRYERDPKGFNSAWALTTPPSQIAGLGPFRLEALEGEKLSFARNPHYWKRDIRGTALPYVKELTVLTSLPESATQLFRNRQIHFFYPRPADLPILQSDKASGRLAINDDITNGQANFGGQFLVVNGDAANSALRAVFRTAEFRRALSFAVPRAQLVRDALLGLGIETYGPISPASPYFVGRPGQDPKIVERFRALQTPSDLQKAAQLLEGLGLKDTNNDGVREIPQNFLGQGNPSGRLEFELLIESRNLLTEGLTRLLLPALAHIGINPRLTLVQGELLDRLVKGQYEAAIVRWDGAGRFTEWGGDSQPDDLLSQRAIWLCQGLLHLFSRGCTAQPTELERTLDELLQRADLAPTLPEAKTLQDEAQLLIVEALPIIPLVQVHGLLVYRSDVLRNHERRPTFKLDVLFCERGMC
uniref:Extracellular solute-binding protein n=2 Tax=Candidatus Bipolaricaulota TaxID=67810 RepID=H5SJC8_9BACT|nr:extracellular solute-binding protein [uncultured Acetothermia bacterium]BAL58995.1 extracellular solute-binding protein [Candidatus Acetothermum autotrophicum]